MRSRAVSRTRRELCVAMGGGGAPYSETTDTCRRCGGRILLEIGTDGNGHLVETPRPCRACAQAARPCFHKGTPGRPLKAAPGRPLKVAPAPKVAPAIDRITEICIALLGGIPTNAVARDIGIDRQVVVRVRRSLQAEGKVAMCRCGKPAFHVGRCFGKQK